MIYHISNEKSRQISTQCLFYHYASTQNNATFLPQSHYFICGSTTNDLLSLYVFFYLTNLE